MNKILCSVLAGLWVVLAYMAIMVFIHFVITPMVSPELALCLTGFLGAVVGVLVYSYYD